MLRKRVIFTLLYADGQFMLSRNFRLQKVGDLNWLQKNYDFSNVAFFIDELVVLDVSRGVRNFKMFCKTLEILSKGCFIPISAGGGIRSVEDAKNLLRSGADKIVINSALIDNLDLVRDISDEFGQQSIVGSVDLMRGGLNKYELYIHNGSTRCETSEKYIWKWTEMKIVGEIYLNSMDRDGTGQGFDLDMLDIIPERCDLPLILAGGVGNAKHLKIGLNHKSVNAVATANLFNFVGNGLIKARKYLVEDGINLAKWEIKSDQS